MYRVMIPFGDCGGFQVTVMLYGLLLSRTTAVGGLPGTVVIIGDSFNNNNIIYELLTLCIFKIKNCSDTMHALCIKFDFKLTNLLREYELAYTPLSY